MNNRQAGVLRESITTEQRVRAQWETSNAVAMMTKQDNPNLDWVEEAKESPEASMETERVRTSPPPGWDPNGLANTARFNDRTESYMGPVRDAYTVDCGGDSVHPAFERWTKNPHKDNYSRWSNGKSMSDFDSTPDFTKRYRPYKPQRSLWHENGSFPLARKDGEKKKKMRRPLTKEPQTMPFREELVLPLRAGNGNGSLPAVGAGSGSGFGSQFSSRAATTAPDGVGGHVQGANCPSELKVVNNWYTHRTQKGKPDPPLSKSHLPGYGGHVQTHKFEISRSFGRISRDVLHYSSGGRRDKDTRDPYLEMF